MEQAIIGADLLHAHGLVINLCGRFIQNSSTQYSTVASIVHVTSPVRPVVNLLSTRQPALSLLSQFPSITRPYSAVHPVKHSVLHHLTTNDTPLHARARCLPPDKLNAARAEFQHMLELGIFLPSASAWSSALHVIMKSSGDWQPCGNYCALNGITVSNRYPIPNLEDFTSQLHGCTCFSNVDLVKAFQQIPLHEFDNPKTAVITPFGLFEFVRMPFGLRKAAQTFQRFVDQVIRGLPFCFAYIDDLLIASPDPATHLTHWHLLFERLAEHGFVIQPSKCQFAVAELDFLGHHVSARYYSLASNDSEIMDYQQPSTAHALRWFLGLVNFYHRFVPHFADILAPLHSLLASHPLKPKHAPLTWNVSSLKAFRDIKTALSNATLLNHPAPSAELCLMTDASQTGIGGVLQQNIGNAWQPIAFFSRKLHDTHRRYSTFGRKLLAVHSAIKHFRPFLEGRNFFTAADNQALTSALASPLDRYNPREVRHLQFISEFTIDIRHVPGDANPAADALSRSSLNQVASAVDFVAVAEAQTTDNELTALRTRSDNALT